MNLFVPRRLRQPNIATINAFNQASELVVGNCDCIAASPELTLVDYSLDARPPWRFAQDFLRPLAHVIAEIRQRKLVKVRRQCYSVRAHILEQHDISDVRVLKRVRLDDHIECICCRTPERGIQFLTAVLFVCNRRECLVEQLTLGKINATLFFKLSMLVLPQDRPSSDKTHR